MENAWSEQQAHGSEVEETEVPDHEFEQQIGELPPGTVDE
mgnify:CR=1 FL=1